MFLKEEKIIKYKNYTIVKEKTDKSHPKYIYSILGKYEMFYKLTDAKQFIDSIV